MRVSLADYSDYQLDEYEDHLTEMLVSMMSAGMSKEVGLSLLARDLGIEVEQLKHYLKLIKKKKIRIRELKKKKDKNRAKAKEARKARKRGR